MATTVRPTDPTPLRAGAPAVRAEPHAARARRTSIRPSWPGSASIFFGGWMCVGRSADLAKVGSQTAVQVGYGQRAADPRRGRRAARLRERLPAPRPRAAALRRLGRRKRAIVCPYHAWTYKHDGSLRGAPHFNERRELRPVDARPAGRCRCSEWHGWVFVDRVRARRRTSPSTSARSRRSSRRTTPESLVTAETHEYDVAANWKVIVENYQECYHCSMIHPELCRVSPPDERREPRARRATGSAAGWTCATAPRRCRSTAAAAASTMARLDEHELRTVMYVAVLPNLLICLHPDYVMTHLLVPLAPDRTADRPARGRSRPTSSPGRASTRRTPWTSGTSPTARTGPPASRCSAACRRRTCVAGPAGPRRGRRLPLRHPRRAPLPRRLAARWDGVRRIGAWQGGSAARTSQLVRERARIEEVVREHVTLQAARAAAPSRACAPSTTRSPRRFHVRPQRRLSATASAAARAATSSRSCRRSTT